MTENELNKDIDQFYESMHFYSDNENFISVYSKHIDRSDEDRINKSSLKSHIEKSVKDGIHDIDKLFPNGGSLISLKKVSSFSGSITNYNEMPAYTCLMVLEENGESEIEITIGGNTKTLKLKKGNIYLTTSIPLIKYRVTGIDKGLLVVMK